MRTACTHRDRIVIISPFLTSNTIQHIPYTCTHDALKNASKKQTYSSATTRWCDVPRMQKHQSSGASGHGAFCLAGTLARLQHALRNARAKARALVPQWRHRRWEWNTTTTADVDDADNDDNADEGAGRHSQARHTAHVVRARLHARVRIGHCL